MTARGDTKQNLFVADYKFDIACNFPRPKGYLWVFFTPQGTDFVHDPTKMVVSYSSERDVPKEVWDEIEEEKDSTQALIIICAVAAGVILLVVLVVIFMAVSSL